jgi:small-conductance mechanosensitive channel
VSFDEFGDSSITLKVWLEATDWWHHFQVRDSFIRLVHDRFKREKIVIPFPIRTLDMPPAVVKAFERMGQQAPAQTLPEPVASEGGEPKPS